LQSRWPKGGEWKNWGFFYETETLKGKAPIACHHNLDEKHWVVHDITQCTSAQGMTLEHVESAVAKHSDRYRVLDEIYTHEFDGPVSAAINIIEAHILGLDHFVPQAAPEEDMCIFSGRANRPLAQAIAHRLGLPLAAISITPLPDSEVHIQVDEAVRKKNVVVVQPCSAPVNDHLVELLLMIDAFRRASAASITAVIPYFPYARQERMARGREAISARVVATMLEAVGVNRVIYIDIHAEATQGFFTVPVDRLQAFPILSHYFRKKPFLEDAVVVSPDVGRAKLAGRYAQAIGVPLVVMHKRRESFREAKATHVVGDVKDKVPILIDDIVAGGSIIKEIPVLFEHGARKQVHLAITHPVLLPTAMKMLDNEWIAEMVVTDTVLVPPAKQHPKLRKVSVAPMLEYAIRGIYHGTSISPLWEPDAPRRLGFT
jgi:ribose-phosphate pyrophosphokinase